MFKRKSKNDELAKEALEALQYARQQLDHVIRLATQPRVVRREVVRLVAPALPRGR